MTLKRMDVDELQIGMYVAQLDRPWLESGFLFQGFRIHDGPMLERVRSTCRHVYIDLEKGYQGPNQSIRKPPPDSLPKKPSPEPSERPAEIIPEEPDFRKGLVQAYRHRERATRYLGTVVENARSGKRVETESVNQVVNGLIKSVKVNVNASMWLNNLKRRHEHSATHCANVAVVALAFAHYLGYRGKDLSAIGIGAVLHDVGLMRLSRKLLDKPGELSPAEQQELQDHPTAGYRLMQRSGDLPEMALNIIRYHHERVNGKGYPEGLSGSQIPREALVVAIADVYDAMISERPYRTPFSPHSSLTMIKQLSETDFGPKLVQQFMSCIGIYPINSVVQLNNFSIAMVVGHTHRTRLRPEVMLLKNHEGKTYRHWPVLDIDKRSEKGDSEQWQIFRVVSPEDYGVDLAKVCEAYIDRMYPRESALTG